MRFKPGTTQAQMQAAMEALANRPKTRGPAGNGGTRPYGVGGPLPEAINPVRRNFDDVRAPGMGGANPYTLNKPADYQPGTRPYGAGGPPPQAIDYPRPVGGTRPYGGSMNLGTAGGPGGGRPGMGVPPSSQINPAQPNVMGFPDRGVGGANQYNINKPSDYQPGTRPYGASANLGTTGGPGGGRPDMLGMGQQAIQPQDTSGMTVPGGPKQGVVNRVFAKGGKVSAKAPVKKAAGGKIAAKAPVKKAMGGKVAAKPMAKPVAKKAKPMSAMKRGGKVTMKGRYK